MVQKIIEKAKFEAFFLNLSRKHRVFGPVKRKNDVSFQEVASADELFLEYTTTTLPPKKFFHRRETLFDYDEKKIEVPKLQEKNPLLLLGVHACDLNAILRQDKFFAGDFEDPYYLRRRENTTIVALSCDNPDESCFCASMGTGPTVDGSFDILLTNIDENYLIEVGSDKGKEILDGLDLENASNTYLESKNKLITKTRFKFSKEMDINGLDKLAAANPDHEVWSVIGEEGGLANCHACLSCGSCSLVCPTCYCYEVVDIPDLELKKGSRIRELDSCQLLEYALVALDHNFRPERKDRIRHWMNCKFGAAGGGEHSSCVGCGRCIRSCPSKIDLTEVAKNLREG